MISSPNKPPKHRVPILLVATLVETGILVTEAITFGCLGLFTNYVTQGRGGGGLKRLVFCYVFIVKSVTEGGGWGLKRPKFALRNL